MPQPFPKVLQPPTQRNEYLRTFVCNSFIRQLPLSLWFQRFGSNSPHFCFDFNLLDASLDVWPQCVTLVKYLLLSNSATTDSELKHTMVDFFNLGVPSSPPPPPRPQPYLLGLTASSVFQTQIQQPLPRRGKIGFLLISYPPLSRVASTPNGAKTNLH